MQMYTFETDVPIPAPEKSYPFKALEVGESVLYLTTDKAKKRRAYKAANALIARKGWQIVIRTLPDGVRVWRLR